MSQSIVRYDHALPILIEILLEEFGEGFLRENLVMRDADGLLSVVLKVNYSDEQISGLADLIRDRVGSYACHDCVIKIEDLFEDYHLGESSDSWELVEVFGSGKHYVRFREKRIVGNDWVRGFQQSINGAPPIVVFASLKGGVGRSTALAVAANDLMANGYSVLAIDLDLEAPGIGGMLIPKAELPSFGAIDYYVEFGRSSLDQTFLSNMIFSLSHQGGGNLDVVPAAGKLIDQYPENVIGKLSRAYLEAVNADGKPLSFLDKTREMITALTAFKKYDVVFVDARAGLNESTAVTIQGLGADVLFFGVDTPQTWEGYKYFFAHLARYKGESSLNVSDDWRLRLKMVHAKARPGETSQKKFHDSAYELFASYLYDEIPGEEIAEGSPELFSFDLDDRDAPHFAWPIYMSEVFFEFDPLNDGRQIVGEELAPVFGEFLAQLKSRVML